jgi:hypothetical protein
MSQEAIKNAVAAVPLVAQVKSSIPFSLGMCSHDPARAQEAAFHWHRSLKDLSNDPIPVMCVNAKSMASGYNQIISQCPTEYLILSHHDAWPFPISNYFIGKRLLERMKDVDVLGFAGAGRVMGPRWFDDSTATVGHVINFPADAPGSVVPPEIQRMRAEGMRPCMCTSWGRPARLVRNVRVADGYCLVVRTDAAKKVLFDEKFNHFHYYDMDFVMAAHAAGLRTAVCCDLYITHNSTGSYVQPEWAGGLEYFLEKWKQKFDGTITGVGRSATAIQSGDARLALLALQREEAWMASEVSF